MSMNRTLMLLVAATSLGLAGVASADETQPTVATNPSVGPTSPMRLGITLSPMPVGTFKAAAGGLSASSDAKFAFGIVPTFDYNINEYLFVGLAPQIILNVIPKDADGKAAKELDLRARVGGNAKVADTIRLFGYLAPGYSIIMFPDKMDGLSNPAGFVLGFAGGALFDLTPSVFANAEVGYQVGFQSVSFMGASADLKTNYLHIGLGIGVRL
jgi:hypothetical protein